MVNKIAVLLVGGIVLVAVVVMGGVAALVLTGGGDGGGAGSTGGGGGSTPTAVDPTPLPSPGPETPNATVTPTTPTATATATPTATPVPTPTATPKPDPSDFNETNIETLIADEINDRRERQGLDRLSRSGSTVADLNEMARAHSTSMARRGNLTHVINGTTSADRYRQNDLYQVCKWKRPGEDGFASPDNNGIEVSENGFEMIGRTAAGRETEVVNDTRFIGTDEDAADAVVDQWFNTTYPRYPERLTFVNASRVGVGVEVTQYGEVYATANLC